MALFAGFAAHRLMFYVPKLASRIRLAGPAYASLAVLALMPVVALVRENSKTNDQSYNTVVNDFYEEVFERLPQIVCWLVCGAFSAMTCSTTVSSTIPGPM